jgi:hypothetical protein
VSLRENRDIIGMRTGGHKKKKDRPAFLLKKPLGCPNDALHLPGTGS